MLRLFRDVNVILRLPRNYQSYGCDALQAFVFLAEARPLLFRLASPLSVHADTVSGTIVDPSGAVIAGARVEIAGGDLAQPLVLSSDAMGRFSSPDLKPGIYALRVTRDGLEPLAKPVELHGAVNLELRLAIAEQRLEITEPRGNSGGGGNGIGALERGCENAGNRP